MLSLAYGAAFLLRFDGELPLQMVKRMVFTWPYVVLLELGALYMFAVPRFVWAYVGLREATRMLWAVLLAAVVLLGARFLSAWAKPWSGYVEYALVPIGVIVANTLFAFLGVAGVRVARRLFNESRAARQRPRVQSVPTLLVGAGRAGVMVAKEIASHPDVPFEVVGFLDDDPGKAGLTVHGVPVLGRTLDLVEAARATGASQAVITMTEARGDVMRGILALCKDAGVRAKVIPGVYQILDESVNLSRIRDVSIEDLLGREPVELDTELVRSFLQGKRVAVTGAGGSIGSELCRQVARFAPSELVLVEQAEYPLFMIQQELLRDFPPLAIAPVVCDICDSARVESVFRKCRPQIVFHAAAHKHVPMMELNPGEAVKNNVFGTCKVADAADRFGSEAFVLISTDKAVNPTSIMGATKRVAEMYIQSLSQVSTTQYVAVRFGNVLGSTGSVVPIFKAQISEGRPVTVTHPEMQRYFMTIPEASQLVMQAAAMGHGGQIFVLDMGTPVRIVDLARELIRLSGFEPDVDIPIQFTGIRPGEKLFEEIAFDAEKMDRTQHQKIFIGRLSPVGMDEVRRRLVLLETCTSAASADQVREALQQVVPEMRRSMAPALERPEPERAGELPASPVPVAAVS
ncbi:MAG: polysaccharide biosynthesis protein [Polyangiaceae bacterium]|nr:polysaccharide biosynthesis protein [Polyangiaceae bacterium]